jgi:hypothetical protein
MKVNDKVKVIVKDSAFEGMVGVVFDVIEGDVMPYGVTFPDDDLSNFAQGVTGFYFKAKELKAI